MFEADVLHQQHGSHAAVAQLAEDAVFAEEIAVGVGRDGVLIVPGADEGGAGSRAGPPRPGPGRRPGLLLGRRGRRQRPLLRGAYLRTVEGPVGPLRVALALRRAGIHGLPPRSPRSPPVWGDRPRLLRRGRRFRPPRGLQADSLNPFILDLAGPRDIHAHLIRAPVMEFVSVAGYDPAGGGDPTLSRIVHCHSSARIGSVNGSSPCRV